MRYRSLDLMRATAIVVMVAVHFVENLSGLVPFAAGLGAPLFIVLSGASYRLWLDVQKRRGADEVLIGKRTVRRGLFLFGVGIAFNVFVWLPEDVFNWDVLTLIGSGFLALAIFRHVPPAATIALCALLVLVTPGTQAAAAWAEYWVNPYYDYDFTLPDVLLGYLSNGYFPLLPWIAYPLVGYVAADFVLARPAEVLRAAGRLAFVGAFLILLGYGLLHLGTSYPVLRKGGMLGGWRMNVPSLEYTLTSLGMALFYLGSALATFDSRPAEPHAKGPWPVIILFSRYSLTLYILHHLMHVWVLWSYGISQGKATTHYWRQALSVGQSLALGGAFLVFAYFFLRWLDRRRRWSLEGLMRWVCD